MSALLQSQQAIDAQSSVTTISANARIDYILRFSKQAVLIIDDDLNNCSSVCSHYLSTLSENHNAAYLSISPKLNDIQLRCRIIEQLFPNTLFDPEQSLAVSTINLAKASGEAISIVIENMHHASLQLLHELSQIALIAKKSGQTINIVLAGTRQAALLASENSALFNNTLSLLSAQTGQLLSLNAKHYKQAGSFKINKATKVVLATLVILAVITASTYLVFSNSQLFGFSDLPKSQTNIVTEQSDKLVAVTTTEILQDEGTAIATSQEVAAALLGQLQASAINEVQPVNAEPVASTPAETALIIEGMFLEKSTYKTPVRALEKPLKEESTLVTPETVIPLRQIVEEKSSTLTQTPKSNSTTLTLMNTDSSYYSNFQSGYVVQYSGFTQQKALDEFLLANRGLAYQGYNRLLNNQAMLVLTSAVFDSSEAAKNHLSTLPESIISSGAFIKSATAINTEIKQFESSQ